jgi:alginate O-acetyltransferase complex protein AlgI
MLFNSYEFLLVFLPAEILIYWFADKSERWRTWVLILLSLVFYSYWDVRFPPVMLASILLNWWAASLYVATRRRVVIIAAIVGEYLGRCPDLSFGYLYLTLRARIACCPI